MDKRIDKSLGILNTTLALRRSDSDVFAVINEAARSSGKHPREVMTDMIYLKLARVKHGYAREDSLIDIAGYAILCHAFLTDHYVENTDG